MRLIDPLIFPTPSFFQATRLISEHVAAGGEFTLGELEKITGIRNQRMLFEAAWSAADDLPTPVHFRCRRLAGTWWREWILIVAPPRVH